MPSVRPSWLSQSVPVFLTGEEGQALSGLSRDRWRQAVKDGVIGSYGGSTLMRWSDLPGVTSGSEHPRYQVPAKDPYVPGSQKWGPDSLKGWPILQSSFPWNHWLLSCGGVASQGRPVLLGQSS